MAKYLVTNGSYFQPFTYDELSKPIVQAVEAHNAAQDAYDTINAETAALKRYITDNPEDSDAKQIYDDYVTKLESLQNNLWNNGYNASTRRDLSAARAGYFSDITRLATVIKNRQDRGAAWSKFKMEHPEAATGDNPALAGLNKYLENDNYGLDFFNYSGKTLMEEVGAEVQAMGNDVLQTPEVLRNPELTGRIITKLQQGFSNTEISNAQSYVRGALKDDGSGLSKSERLAAAISSLGGNTDLSMEEKLLAGAVLSRLQSTGAADKVNESEFNKLLGYAELGMKAGGIQKPKYDFQEDLEWKRNAAWEDKQKEAEFTQKMELDTYEKKKQIDAKYPTAKTTGSGSGSGSTVSGSNPDESISYNGYSLGYTMPSYQQDIISKDAGKKVKAYNNAFNKVSEDHPLNLVIDGKQQEPITDPEKAQEVLYKNQYWKQAMDKYGLDLRGGMGHMEQTAPAYIAFRDGRRIETSRYTDKLKEEDAKLLGLNPADDNVAVYIVDPSDGKAKIDPEATREINRLIKDDADYRAKVEKESKIKFSDYDNGPEDLKKIKKRWNIEDPQNKLIDHYDTIAAIKTERGFRTVTPAPLVNTDNRTALDTYIDQLLTSSYANAGLDGKNTKYKLHGLSSANTVTNDTYSVEAILSDEKGNVKKEKAFAISATPELLEEGYLMLITDRGRFAAPVRMFDDIFTSALEKDRVTDIDGKPVSIGNIMSTVEFLMRPFDHPESVFGMTDMESKQYSDEAMFYLDPYYYVNRGQYRSIKDIMSNEETRAGYYADIVKFIEAAFAQPRETRTRLNFRVRSDTSDKAEPMFHSK